MYSVLIVDDEPRHRRGLANMVAELRPDYSVFEAKNGKQALEMINTTNIEIVLTDIRMPIMDGLQFMENLGDRKSDIKVIIISGYNYFKYAQQALRLGAFDYMLKPVDVNKVTEVLELTERALQKERSEKYDRENTIKLLTKSMPVYLERRMNRWINGTLKNNEMEEVKDLFHLSSKKTIIVTEIKRSEFESIYTDSDALEEIRTNIEEYIAEALKPIGSSISFYLEDCPNRLISIVELYMDIVYKQEETKTLLMDFITRLETEYELHVLIGVGNLFAAIDGSERISYEAAVKAVESKFHLGFGRVLFPCEYMEDVSLNLEERKNTKNNDIIITCMKYIDEHYMEELSLDSISERYYFNPSYFSSIFKNYTGVNVSDYLMNVRLKKAKELLREPIIRVYEVAIQVGYKDAKYFNRIFKKKLGMTPEEYRRNLYKKEIPMHE